MPQLPDDTPYGADWSEEDAEHARVLHELVESAAASTVKQRLPYDSTNRVMKFLSQSWSPAEDLYAMLRAWLEIWRGMVDRVISDATAEEYWDVAEVHRLLPENGGDPHARRLVGAFLLRVLDDEELRSRIEGGTDLDQAERDEAAFYYNNIFRPGPDVQRDCVFIVLFMMKSAAVDIVTG